MKNIVFLLSTFLTLQVFAQTDSVQTSLNAATYTSVASLTKAEIERLPATSFLELVQGAFPFINNTSTIEEDYAFVVNGFVAINPNAINLSQLESIHFYPAGTTFTRGSLARKGTFVISTRPQKSGIQFSTKTGLLTSDEGSRAASISSAGTGFTTFNDLSVQHNGERSFLSSAISYLRDNHPDRSYLSPNNHQTFNYNFSRIRLSNFAGVQFNQQWALEGGLFFTGQPQKSNLLDRHTTVNVLQKQTRNQEVLYAGGHAGLRFSPSEKLSNLLQAEVTYAEEEMDHLSTTTYQTGLNYRGSSNTDGTYKTYAFTNRFSWKPVFTSAISLEASLLGRYRIAKTEEKNQSVNNSSQGPINAGGWIINDMSKSFAVSPAINFTLKNILSAEVGATYDNYRNSFTGPNEKKKILPNGGLKLELASLINGSGITSLEIASNYQQYLRTYERMDRLEGEYYFTAPGLVFPNIDRESTAYTPSKNWLSTITLAGWNNRFSIRGGYRIHDRMIKAYLPVWVGTGTGHVQVYEPLMTKTWSVELKSVLLQKEDKSWTLYTTALQDKYTRKNWGTGGFTSISTVGEPAFLDAGKAPWRVGLRTALQLSRFHFQAAALLNLQEAFNSGTFVDDMTTYRTNFLLAGYRWPLRSKRIKGLEANLQSRNLFSTKNYAPLKYIGAGVHFSF